MKKWWAMVGIVAVAVVILAVCLYGLPFDSSAVFPSGMTSSQSWTTLPPETTEETLPWQPFDEHVISYTSTLSSSRENPDHSYEITRQVVPETVDNPDGLPVLKWVCLINTLTNRDKKPWNEAAVVEFNQMLADRDLPYRVQFTLLTVSAAAMPWDLFTNPKIQKDLEDADLIYGYYYAPEMEQWLMPITDHVYGDAQPSLAGAMPDRLSWFGVEANGEIYGIPRFPDDSARPGWSVDPDLMVQYGLTVEDFQKDFWELEELFAEVYEKNGNQPLMSTQYANNYGGFMLPNSAVASVPYGQSFMYSDYQGICLNLSIDLLAEKPTVINVLETERFAKLNDAILRCMEAGYMKPLEGPGYMPFQVALSVSSSEPYMATFDNRYMIPIESRKLINLGYAMMTGISAKSSRTEEALSLLERIINDEALRLQLCYGKEGRDYTLDGNVYSLIKQKDGSRYFMDFLSPQAIFFDFTGADEETSWMVASTSDTIIPRQEGMTRLESYKADLAGATVSYCPIVFELSELDPELSAMTEVLRTYYPMFGHPERYSDEFFQRMLRDLNDAGMQTVITELQRQLDAWIAEHPNWDPFN